MNIEEIRDYCLAKKGAEESFPFDSDTLVFKVGGKMFVLMSITTRPVQFNAKCDPDRAIELRENYSSIVPGFHMSKSHWNTVICDGRLSKKFIFSLIDDSYAIIVSGLPKKTRAQFGL